MKDEVEQEENVESESAIFLGGEEMMWKKEKRGGEGKEAREAVSCWSVYER